MADAAGLPFSDASFRREKIGISHRIPRFFRQQWFGAAPVFLRHRIQKLIGHRPDTLPFRFPAAARQGEQNNKAERAEETGGSDKQT